MDASPTAEYMHLSNYINSPGTVFHNYTGKKKLHGMLNYMDTLNFFAGERVIA